jgi:uncharacterized protein YjbJ (UPF0337 family)
VLPKAWAVTEPHFYILHDVPSDVAGSVNQPQRQYPMNDHQVEGTVNKFAGRVQDAAGALAGDADQQVKGKARAIAGDVQAKAGDAVEQVREWAADRPLSTVLVTAGVSFVLGILWARRD